MNKICCLKYVKIENLFNDSPISSIVNPQHLSVDDEHSGPITYEIFMNQQRQQNQTTCCNLYDNEILSSSHTISPVNNILEKPIKHQLNDSTTLPLPLPSSISQHETLTKLTKNNISYVCSRPGCERTFNTLSYLRNHEKNHSCIKPYPCTWPECDWKFARSDELTRHYRKHTGIKPYSCTNCDRAFYRGDHLKVHMKSHSRKKLNHKAKYQ